MSRSGYSDDCEHLELYRGNVDRSLRSKRGQAFLGELAVALDAMPERKLIKHELIDSNGDCCAMGAVCKARGTDVSFVDPDDPERVAATVGIAKIMAAEIAFMNDEWSDNETPEQRWERMREWVGKNLQSVA